MFGIIIFSAVLDFVSNTDGPGGKAVKSSGGGNENQQHTANPRFFISALPGAIGDQYSSWRVLSSRRQPCPEKPVPASLQPSAGSYCPFILLSVLPLGPKENHWVSTQARRRFQQCDCGWGSPLHPFSWLLWRVNGLAWPGALGLWLLLGAYRAAGSLWWENHKLLSC